MTRARSTARMRCWCREQFFNSLVRLREQATGERGAGLRAGGDLAGPIERCGRRVDCVVGAGPMGNVGRADAMADGGR